MLKDQKAAVAAASTSTNTSKSDKKKAPAVVLNLEEELTKSLRDEVISLSDLNHQIVIISVL